MLLHKTMRRLSPLHILVCQGPRTMLPVGGSPSIWRMNYYDRRRGWYLVTCIKLSLPCPTLWWKDEINTDTYTEAQLSLRPLSTTSMSLSRPVTPKLPCRARVQTSRPPVAHWTDMTSVVAVSSLSHCQMKQMTIVWYRLWKRTHENNF